MRIGILGGTFDPPHQAHLAMAQAAAEQLELDEVLWVPTGRSAFKSKVISTPAKDRMRMVELAIADESKMSCSDIEITRPGPSFMVETLMELQMASPADYWLILGSDQFKSFVEWKNPHRILQLCRLAVILRAPDTRASIDAFAADWVLARTDFVDMAPMQISSTQLRKHLTEGAAPERALKPAVRTYIAERRLYKGK